MAKKRKFEGGGDVDAEEAQYKAAGLAASNAENKKPSGFFGRLSEGNIDEKGSEAYEKYGAGYGRKLAAQRAAEATPTTAPAAPAAAPAAPAAAAAAPAAAAKYKGSSAYSDTVDMKRNQGSAAATPAKPVENKMAQDASQAPLAPSDIADMKRVAFSGTKPVSSNRFVSPTNQSAIAKAYSDTSRAKDVPPKTSNATPVDDGGKPANAGPDVLTSNFSRNTQTYPTAQAFNANVEADAKKRLGSAGAKGPTYAQLAEYEAANAKKRLGSGGGRGPTYAQLREDEAAKAKKRLGSAGAKGPTAEMVKSANTKKPASKDDYMKSRDQYKTAQDDSEPSTFRKGGAIKSYASGGSVAASSRGDGIAQRGKTRGRMC